MSSISFSLPEVVAYRLLMESQRRQVSIPTLIEQLLPRKEDESSKPETLGSDESISEMAEHICQVVNQLPQGTVFTFGEIFKDIWSEIPSQSVTMRMCSQRLRKEGSIEFVQNNVLPAKGMSRMNQYIKL
jgi:hypothetical protein